MTFHIPLILLWYLLASLVTFGAYGYDKDRARKSAWRMKESTLHLLELAGGWPGAFVAQRVFHHKWRKTKFMLVFWAIVMLHLLAWGAWGWHRFVAR